MRSLLDEISQLTNLDSFQHSSIVPYSHPKKSLQIIEVVACVGNNRQVPARCLTRWPNEVFSSQNHDIHYLKIRALVIVPIHTIYIKNL